MSSRHSNSNDSINGLRTAELGSALIWLKDQLAQKLGSGSRSISTVDPITLEEQEIVGITHILTVLFPLATELALKSLWECLHGPDSYPRTHDLEVLFQSLDTDVTDVTAARSVKTEARDLWSNLQTDRKVSFVGTLDDFLAAHANDFAEARYYVTRPHSLQINDPVACFLCFVGPLARRDRATLSNLLARPNVAAVLTPDN